MLFPTDVLEGKTAMLLGMSQWNSNDLVEQIETLGQIDQTRGKSKGTLYQSQSLQSQSFTSQRGTDKNIIIINTYLQND